MAKKLNSDRVATKADIDRLEKSTKSDIDRLEKSTKSEIDKLETKIGKVEHLLLTKYATKSDLNKTVRKSEKVLRAEILRVEEKVENIEEGQKRVEATVNKISNQLDAFVGRVDDLTVENEVGANQTRELDLKVSDHEKRITKLESAN